jgi:hypothetical protein
MISLINPEDHFHAPDPTAAIMKAHMQFTEARIMEALIACFGELPSPEDIRAHCMGATDEDGVTHYVWVDVKPEIGDTVDLSNPLCSIAPPKIFTPSKPEN